MKGFEIKGLRVFIRGVAALAISAQALALENKDYAKCAAKIGDLSRLECFDNLAKTKSLVKETKRLVVRGVGYWLIRHETNPIDDSKTVELTLFPKETPVRAKDIVSLVARCKSNKTEVYISWNDYLGRNSDVLTRIGKNKAKTERWSLSTDSQATFNNNPIKLLKDMMEADSLIAQITPYNDNPKTVVFNTIGLVNAIKPLQEVCGWSS